MARRSMKVLWVLVIALAAIVAVARVARDRGGSPAPALPPAPPAAPAPPAPDPPVPVDLPTPAPGLDRELADDYRTALEGRGVNVGVVTIVDERAAGGARRVEIVYETATDGTPEALRPEVARIVAPAANPRLAVDRIVVRPRRTTGADLGTITISVVDLDLWLKVQIDDDEFYRRWLVESPGR